MNDMNSLSHTKWECKYHIVFAPKYRRKVFYGEKRVEIGKILRMLCDWKKIEIVEAEVCKDHVHMLVELPSSIRRIGAKAFYQCTSIKMLKIITTVIIKLIFITDYRNIRFYVGITCFVKMYCEWCRNHFTRSLVLFYIITDRSGEFHNDFLMFIGWWCHIIDVSINKLGSFSVWQSIDIFNGIRFFFR